jgi:hypothetical protein
MTKPGWDSVGTWLYLKTKNFHWHMTGRHFADPKSQLLGRAIPPLAK